MPELQAEQLKKARNGDMDAFANLFEGYRPLLHRVAFRLVGADDCDDVVMDSFLKVWRSLPGFRGDAKLKTWLCTVVRNCALDHLRKRKKSVNLQPVNDGETDPVQQIPASHEDNPERKAELHDLRCQMNDALEQLSENHRTVLLMHETDGLGYKEIAAATGVRIGTVMSRLFHSKRHMRRILKMREVTP